MWSDGFDGMVYSIATVLSALGDRWAALFVRDLFLGLSPCDRGGGIRVTDGTSRRQ